MREVFQTELAVLFNRHIGNSVFNLEINSSNFDLDNSI